MDVRLHDDLNEFVALTQPFLEADPVRHTIALTALAMLARLPEYAEGPPILLSVHHDDAPAAVAVCTPPRELIVSGLPAECADEAVKVLAPMYPRLPGTVGPRTGCEVTGPRCTRRRAAWRRAMLHCCGRSVGSRWPGRQRVSQ